MLIMLYLFIVNSVLPMMGAYAMAALEPVMIIVIMLAGIVMLFGVVGVRISNNLGSTVVSGIFRLLGYIGRTIINGIRWIVRSIVNLMPRVFRGSRNFFQSTGLSPAISNFLAFMTSAVVLVIII